MKGIEVNIALKKGKAIIESSCINNYRTSDNINIIDEWRTPSMPHINGVDKRAEEFISKVREDMELERQQSILDFQEMLARGV
uniref:Putative ovule protein n=1 Tax=Solanum chacoense TaxID=4108 RepID=A0A0V0HF92_SOLCH